MTREQMYTEQMKALGTYHPVFDPAIHMLACMERELQRDMKKLKKIDAEDAKTLAQLRADIAQERRDILTQRESLGLTPRSLRRMRGSFAEPECEETAPTVLSIVRGRRKEA